MTNDLTSNSMISISKVSDLNNKYAELQPFLEQIDQIDESVSRLFEESDKNYGNLIKLKE